MTFHPMSRLSKCATGWCSMNWRKDPCALARGSGRLDAADASGLRHAYFPVVGAGEREYIYARVRRRLARSSLKQTWAGLAMPAHLFSKISRRNGGFGKVSVSYK